MAPKKQMHPRNPYRAPPRFKDLALKNEEFRHHAMIDISGKVKIDFKNPDALRALTRALLKEDWGLDVVLPSEYLVPTLPLRLNYILWLEDLLAALGHKDSSTSVYGIDIGTGASCIYPLLAAKKNEWHMIGIEKDEKCFNHALQNVLRNKLDSLVKVCRNKGDSLIDSSILEDLFEPAPSYYHFTMCNPPFYESEDDLDRTNKSRSELNPRPPPRSIRTGSLSELIVEGGEVAFVIKMIDESFLMRDKIKIFSSMLGHKSSVSKVMMYLKNKGVSEIAVSEFFQGHVTRWGIAWSHSVHLTCATKEKPRPPFRHVLPLMGNESLSTFETFVAKVTELLTQLQVDLKCIIKKKKLVNYQIIAMSNTWTNQRKKRREQLRLAAHAEQDNSHQDHGPLALPVVEPNEDPSGSSEEPPKKRSRPSEDIPLVVSNVVLKEGDTEEERGRFILEMSWLSGSGGRDAVNQIMQFLKNNL